MTPFGKREIIMYVPVTLSCTARCLWLLLPQVCALRIAHTLGCCCRPECQRPGSGRSLSREVRCKGTDNCRNVQAAGHVHSKPNLQRSLYEDVFCLIAKSATSLSKDSKDFFSYNHDHHPLHLFILRIQIYAQYSRCRSRVYI